MEWGDLAKQVIGLGAPLLGSALGGPPQPTPASVQDCLPSVEPQKLAEAESLWADTIRAEAEAARTALSETGATMRAEIASQDPIQRWWRPAYAWELTLECAALWSVLVHEFWTGDIQTINALIGATTLLATYWGFRFGVLGVYVSGRTREKLSALTGQDQGGLLERVVKAVVKKK
jgi:hypothetical protein